MSIQVKSKQRVTDHGEVFTSEREVNAMLDLVKQETERIDSRFLEPACGNGNFLIEILTRKLAIVKQRYRKSQLDFERNAILALSSIYGVDIQEDNAIECRERLFKYFEAVYTGIFKTKVKPECLVVANYILSKNILVGDALTLLQNNGEPIVFAEWTFINGSSVKRRDYTLDMLLKNQPIKEDNLFSDLGDQAFIPTPSEVYPPTHFLKLTDHA